MSRLGLTAIGLVAMIWASLVPANLEAMQRPDIGQSMKIAHDYGVKGGYRFLKALAMQGRTQDIRLFLTYTTLYGPEIYGTKPADKDWDRTPWLNDGFAGGACLNPDETPEYKRGVIASLTSNRGEKYQTVLTCLEGQGIKAYAKLSDAQALKGYEVCKIKAAIPACFVTGK